MSITIFDRVVFSVRVSTPFSDDGWLWWDNIENLSDDGQHQQYSLFSLCFIEDDRPTGKTRGIQLIILPINIVVAWSA